MRYVQQPFTALTFLQERCANQGHPQNQRQLTAILNAHASFTTPRRGEWELGGLGMPIIEGEARPDFRPSTNTQRTRTV